MGWGRTLLLGDIGNRLDIADAEADIASIRREFSKARRLDESQEESIQQLRQENEQLELCVAALVKALERKGIFTSDEVKNLVNIVEQ